MPGLFRCDRGDYARVLYALAGEAAGASRIRHSLRPLLSRAAVATARTHRAAGCADACFDVIARSDLSAVAQRAKAESDEAIQLSDSRRQPWIASLTLAMT